MQQLLSGVRERQLVKALAASVGSKGVTAVFILVAMPLAKRSLGTQQFVAYGTLTVILGWVSTINIAVGPYLSLVLPHSVVRTTQEEAVRAVSAAFFTALALTLVASGLLLLAPVRFAIAGAITPTDASASVESLVSNALIVVALASAVGTSLAVSDSVRLGLQEQHIVSIWTAVGIGLSALMVILVASLGGDLVAIAWAAFVMPLTGRLINALLLWWRDHERLRPKIRLLQWTQIAEIVKTNGLYSLVQIAGLLGLPTSLILVSRFASNDQAAGFLVLSFFLTLASGFLFPLLIPLLPALQHARSSSDLPWAVRAIGTTMAASIAIGLLTFLFLVFGGPIVGWFYGSGVVAARSVRIVLGLFFVVTLCENAFYLIGLAFFSHNRLTALMLVRGAVTIVLLLALVPGYGVLGASSALLAGTLVTTGLRFPLMYFQLMRALRPQVSAEAERR